MLLGGGGGGAPEPVPQSPTPLLPPSPRRRPCIPAPPPLPTALGCSVINVYLNLITLIAADGRDTVRGRPAGPSSALHRGRGSRRGRTRSRCRLGHDAHRLPTPCLMGCTAAAQEPLDSLQGLLLRIFFFILLTSDAV